MDTPSETQPSNKGITRRDFACRVCCTAAAIGSVSVESSYADPSANYVQQDATELARLVRQGKVRAEDLLEAAIQQLELVNPALNSVVTPMYDEARESIRDGLPNGPFTGVPFLVKDLGAPYAGARYTMGSSLCS